MSATNPGSTPFFFSVVGRALDRRLASNRM